MTRRKQTSEIVALMKKTENLRNIGLVGHIDHGKTTLSDSLLSEAGFLSPELAGEARALDYLEEEQKRGITMKSTNISLYYEESVKGREPFLINLIDTPGHLDFSGKVTRALRLIDGVIVVVDAVEEIIAQSETVIKQALQEGVRPVLFINKVDRLIRELKLSDEQIRKKYSRIINDFNKLIERYAGEPYNKTWKVSPVDGNIVFGSALHKWGFTLEILEGSSLKFIDIRKRYQKETYNKESYSDLAVYLPIHEAILKMVVDHLPNPIKAQKYRIQKIWTGELDSPIGKAMTECNPNGPLIVCLSKVQAIKQHLVATGRVFSGICKKRRDMYLVKEKTNESIQRISLFMGQRRENVEEIPVGNIVAIEGIKGVKSGDTLVESKYSNDMVPFESVKYVSTPVVTVSVEPEYLRDLDRMKQLIEDMLVEDPNLYFEIKKENGEYLLSGTGPLHLEVTADEIKKRGVKLSISEPRAVFKESCKRKSSLISVKSQNGKSSMDLIIERLDNQTFNFFKDHNHASLKFSPRFSQLMKENTNLSQTEIDNFCKCDEDFNVLIFEDFTRNSKQLNDMILEIIETICLSGPLCGEKLTEIKIHVKNFVLSDYNEENIFTDLSTMFYEATKNALEEAKLILLEPIYRTFIQLPPEQVKKTLALLSKYSAKVVQLDQEDDFQTVIEILLPVRYSIKFAEDIRSTTSGKAFWQNEFHAFLEVPSHEAGEIIGNLRFNKGLSW
ncbi:MAG: GTP-binding protein [Candidatus Lokiarchaeota archaeon]|nr:GTP-binding protein [Candidatus Lokiarchaeota archaeon]